MSHPLISALITILLYLGNGFFFTAAMLNVRAGARPLFLTNPTGGAILLGTVLMPLRIQILSFNNARRIGWGSFCFAMIFFVIFWGGAFCIVSKLASWVLG
jgi:hypothetical protein